MKAEASNGRKLLYVLAGSFLVFVIVIALVSRTAVTDTKNGLAANSAGTWPLYADALRQHPTYRLINSKGALSVGVVISTNATDAELESLLRFFRLEVTKGDFLSVGLKPRSNGTLPSGMLVVFRGERCIGELSLHSRMPCGYGEHDDAYYQWGAVNSSEHEAGVIRQAEGREHSLPDFASPIPFPKDQLDEIEAVKTQQRESRRLFAFAMQKQFSYFSDNYNVYTSDEGDDLTIKSDEFKFEAARDRFMQSTYPKVRNAVCKAGFQGVRLRSGLLDDGTLYDPSC